MHNIAVFASGNGTNFEAIAKAINEGRIHDAKIVLLVVDHGDVKVIDRARRLDIPYAIVLLKDYASKKEYEEHILALLQAKEVEWIFLAGYMKIVESTLLDAYPNHIVNIHPALLPAFKGAHAIQDSFNYGVKVFGVTIHYVSPELDGGKIIAQRAFDYVEGEDVDEVESRIHAIEHVLYPETIEKLLHPEEKR